MRRAAFPSLVHGHHDAQADALAWLRSAALLSIGLLWLLLLTEPLTLPTQPPAIAAGKSDVGVDAHTDPEQAQRWALRGRTQAVTGQWDQALASFERATALQPQDARLWAERARAAIVLAGLAQQPPPALAHAWVREALRRDAGEPLALTLQGDLHYAAGDNAAAQQQWRSAQAALSLHDEDLHAALQRRFDRLQGDAELAAQLAAQLATQGSRPASARPR
jgi:Tfp pilus assembly protein PilF